MQAQFWHERWEQQQIGFHQGEINAHLQEFWGRLGLAAGGRVFVPLCGKSRDMLWLRAEGYEVLGVELSRIAVSDFFRESGVEPAVHRQGPFERWEADGLVLLCGDFFDLEPADLDGVVGVYDRASLVALPPPMRMDYATHLQAILPADVPSLLVSMEYDQALMQGPPFSVDAAEVARLFRQWDRVEPLFDADLIEENPGFKARGLNRLVETVYRLDLGG